MTLTRLEIAQKAQLAVDFLQSQIRKYQPIAVFGLFSGGHDSTTSTYIASCQPQFTAAVHINTGIGVKRTNQFVHDTCKARGWRLIELKASENTYADGRPNPMIYKELVLKYGFPGPAGHGFMYVKLKERALHRLCRQFGASARKKKFIMFVGGCRSKESVRRMGNVEPVQERGREIWVNPIHDWSKCDTSDLMAMAGIERNPVVDLIHKSGECLCGAFAKPGELDELAMWPETREAYDEIISLQSEVAKTGNHAIWGTRPPRKTIRCTSEPGQLCWSCIKGES